MTEDVPTGWGRLLSLESLCLLVAIGISWGTLSQRVTALDERVEANKDARKEEVLAVKTQTAQLTNEVTIINRKLDVLVNNQDHFKAQIKAQDEKLTEIIQLIGQRNER